MKNIIIYCTILVIVLTAVNIATVYYVKNIILNDAKPTPRAISFEI